VLQLLLEVLAYADVLVKHRAEGLVIGVPTRAPVAVNREAEANRVNFLSHCDSLNADLDHNVASLLLDTVTAALGPGGKTLHRLCFIDVDGGDTQFVDIGAVVMLGVGNRGFKRLLDDARGFLRCESQDIQRLSHRLATDEIRYKTGFLRGNMDSTDNCCSFHHLPLGLFVRHVTLERTGQGELAELVTDHVLVDVNGNMLAAIVHSNRQPNELGQDGGTARPGFDRLFVFAFDGRIDLFDQMRVDEWAFLDRT